MELKILNEMIGKTFTSVEKSKYDEIIFKCTDGSLYKIYHEQDCCESVWIEDVCGDLSDLENSPILQAEETSNADIIDELGDNPEMQIWTFYKFATIKGSITIRFNSDYTRYYSIRVDVVHIDKNSKSQRINKHKPTILKNVKDKKLYKPWG